MEVTHKPLTKQELKKMSTIGAMPPGAELWARTVALQTTQTQQQIATVREISGYAILHKKRCVCMG